jgi:phage replication-related protein YjqB (UPF0714/DUF867 family)
MTIVANNISIPRKCADCEDDYIAAHQMIQTTVLRSQSTDLHIGRRGFLAGMAAIATLANTRANVALAGGEVQLTPSPLSIDVEIDVALQSQNLVGKPGACSVSAELAEQLGLGAQIRICRNGDHCALYTITEIRENDPFELVRLSKVARERLGTTNSGFAATLRQALATQQMSDNQAKDASEFVERIQDSGDHQGLLVMAPHGGGIEINTDRQARRVAELLAGADVSTWCCKGWKSGGGAWDRWHVTSTLISPASFPGLASVSKRNFAYAVAFHGMEPDGVLIGGSAPKHIKQLLEQEIAAALGDGVGPVKIAKKGESLGGNDPDNVTNWVTEQGAGGIQIEQSYEVRKNHWQDVADAVASVFAGLV